MARLRAEQRSQFFTVLPKSPSPATNLSMRNGFMEIMLRVTPRRTALFPIGIAVLFAQSSGRAQSPDALPFTTSYSVTGNYVVGGVDLLPQSGAGGAVTATIPMSGVPAN